jgi:hypothetical protein
MVAAAYSERRREVAKTLGLGRKGRVAPVEAARACRGGGRCQAGRKKAVKPAADAPVVVAEKAPAARRGRKAKVVEEAVVTDAVKPAAKRARKAKPEQVSEDVTA